MIRRYCDGCGVEITGNLGNDPSGRLKYDGSEIMVEVIVGTKPAWNSGDQCLACIVCAVLGAAYIVCDTNEDKLYDEAEEALRAAITAARPAGAA